MNATLDKFFSTKKYDCFSAYVTGNSSHTADIKKYVCFSGILNCTLSVIFKTWVTTASAYLDSDALRDFKVLLPSVACSKYLSVLITFQVLTKPWCLLEIATAQKIYSCANITRATI